VPGGILRSIFADPRALVRSYLGADEKVLHMDEPSLRAFLVASIRELLIAIGLVALCVWWIARGGSVAVTVVLFLAVDILLLWLVIQRMEQHFTLYVITSARIMRVSGVLTRHAASIPWAKVTDLTFKQTLFGRWLGYATLRIESANEESGLKDLSSLRDPIRFNRLLVEMLVAKQGNVLPNWVDDRGDARPRSGPVRDATFRRRQTVLDSVIDD
jgi:uncharacterized membrane protein YdbT with pleckstrin-like domain